jgi:hypothetical protein
MERQRCHVDTTRATDAPVDSGGRSCLHVPTCTTGRLASGPELALRPTSPVDVHRQTLDAYDSWLLHVESDERDRLRVQACAGGPVASVGAVLDGPALLPSVDVHRQTLDAYDSWLLHVESDERDQLRVQACADGLTPRLEITGG